MKQLYLLFQKNKRLRAWLLFFSLCFLFILGWYLSLRFGAVAYSNAQLMSVFRHPLTDSNLQDVIFDLRLPRTIAAILVGAAMAQAGSIIQGVTRNPIADPGLLGINAGAGLALIVGYAIFGSMHYSLILITCLFGAILAAIFSIWNSLSSSKRIPTTSTHFSRCYDFNPIFITWSGNNAVF